MENIIIPAQFKSSVDSYHSCSVSPQVLPLEDQTLAKGHLLFSISPWHDFDYAGELDKSNASRSLQVGCTGGDSSVPNREFSHQKVQND